MGAYVPCGHVFHVHCGEGWRYSRRHDCRCPLCNTPTTAFCRIFLDTVQVEKDDDDSSLSEYEDEEEEEDNDGREVSRIQVGDQDDVPVADADQQNASESEVICIEDDEVNETRPKSKPASSSSDSDKYRKKAKKLKRLLAALQTKYDKTVANLHELRDTCQESQGRIEQLDSENKSLESDNCQKQLCIEGIRLDQVRLGRKVEELKQELVHALQRAEDAEKGLRMARQDHERILSRENKNRMTEVERIISDNKRMQLESARLKEENLRIRAKHDAAEKEFLQWRDARNLNNAEQPASIPSKLPESRPKDVAKHLRQMDELKQRDHRRKEDATRKTESAKLCQNKVSETAARMARATDKAISSRPSGTSALALLNLRPLEKRPIDIVTNERRSEPKRNKAAGSAFRIPEHPMLGPRPLQQTLNFRQK